MQVTFEYAIDLSRLSRPGIIEAHPSSGKVAAGEKARIKLKVTAHTLAVASSNTVMHAMQ